MLFFGLLIRLAVIFLILTLVYAILTYLNRNRERDRLKDEYVRSEKTLSREDYVNRGMEDYNYSLRAKLLLGVYIVPLAIFALLSYLANIS